jgi:cyclopropane fatty-acyl-phospholipid synthase-like methyltransferase
MAGQLASCRTRELSCDYAPYYRGIQRALGDRARKGPPMPADLIRRIKGTVNQLRFLFNPDDHALKYRVYDYINTYHLRGLEYTEARAMGHGIWDQYPEVSPARRQPAYILEAGGKPLPGDEILDIGCGLGGFIFHCAENYPHNSGITGVDLDEGNIRSCRQANMYGDRVRFYAADATCLLESSVSELCELVAQKLHRIYILEVSPEIPCDVFTDIVRESYNCLHDDGLLTIMALTLEEPPLSELERSIHFMIRPDSPRLGDILRASEELHCQVTYRDVSDISIKAFCDWAAKHDSLIDDLYIWPFTNLYRRYFQASKMLADRGALRQFDIFIRKTCS